jgi:hypothetical protein
MDLFLFAALAALAVQLWRAQAQGRRIALLGQHLKRFQIEKLMERITEGYQRALGESDPARQDPIWAVLGPAEADLAEQVQGLADEFGRLDPSLTQVGRLGLPPAGRWWPAVLDLRPLLKVHVSGIAEAVRNPDGLAPRERAHRLLAEMLLFQHSCHWYCRTFTVASARLLARHQSTHAQALAAVAPASREAYRAVTGL